MDGENNGSKPYEQMDDFGGFTTPIFGSTPICWVVPPPSNSHHQDYYIFSRESQPKPSFPLLLGGGTTQIIFLSTILISEQIDWTHIHHSHHLAFFQVWPKYQRLVCCGRYVLLKHQGLDHYLWQVELFFVWKGGRSVFFCKCSR